ncbi:redoxin domain-containing protein [Ilyomonas limi]|uniref:Redoxin domain-containing protein n=1 Tax=Ilyomonas limi TaxID=2575867 RepID=A0A4U3L0R8_9BACT|nr:redoxin domain-containing protein [Ilyomonas limi]TKK67754.1 redoxin domain-containing protein [Ilyomonas limi]
MLRKLYLLIIVMNCLHVNAQTNDSVFSVTTLSAIMLLNANNNQSGYFLNPTSEKPSVFIFLSPECPLCKNYSSTLNTLYQQFKNRVAFYGIIPGKAYSSQEIKAFSSNYQISFPLFIDSNKIVSNYLQASITPQVILLDEKHHLLYKGAIDNWAVSLGKQRVKPTQFYLKDAIEESLQNELIAIKRTKAVGCKINDY